MQTDRPCGRQLFWLRRAVAAGTKQIQKMSFTNILKRTSVWQESDKKKLPEPRECWVYVCFMDVFERLLFFGGVLNKLTKYSNLLKKRSQNYKKCSPTRNQKNTKNHTPNLIKKYPKCNPNLTPKMHQRTDNLVPCCVSGGKALPPRPPNHPT